MSNTTAKKSNPLFEVLFNVIIPSFILMKFSGEEHLGTAMALVVALAFPLVYGGMDLIRNKKFNFISALGFISVLLTGGIGLLELDTRWLALKEALIPGTDRYCSVRLNLHSLSANAKACIERYYLEPTTD